MLTRKTLIDSLKANGLTGEVTLETAKAHVATLAAEGIEFADEAGAAIDVDAVWNAKSTIKIADDVAAVKGSKAPHAAIDTNKEPHMFSIGNASRKAYERKVASGKAAFDCADQAEMFGAWARLSLLNNAEYASKKADLEIAGKAGVEFNQQLGGALVPIEFIPNLVWLTEKYGIARKVANVVPMSRDVTQVPRKTAINSMTPISETGTITAGDNTYGNVTLVAKKYGALFQVSRELLVDSAVNIADDIARSIAEAQAIAEDDAYFKGDGSATYANQLGLLNSLPSGAISSATSWSSLALSDFTTMMGKLANIDPARLAFICSRQFFYQVMLKLEKATSQFKMLAEGLPGADVSFLGYPVYFSQRMPLTSTASTHSCYFGDFAGGTMLGDRKQLEVMTSDIYYFNTDSLAVRGISRFCVNIHGDGRAGSNGPIGALLGA
jgi:HK97 family phage major capsid protein